jgi:hypothetical protein
MVSELLKNVVGLGKKVSKGYGWLRDAKITPCDGDFYDTLKRPLPLLFANSKNFGGIIQTMRLVPPYHQFIDAVPCVCPTSNIYK